MSCARMRMDIVEKMVFFWVAGIGTALFLLLSSRSYVFSISTDINSGDIDDTFAIAYIVTRGFFVHGGLSHVMATLRWFVPFLQPYTVRIALESGGDIKLLLRQLGDQMYGPVKRVIGGYLTANYELIEVYQSRYKVVFPHRDKTEYELAHVEGDLYTHLLEIAGPTSCVFKTTGRLLYVGRLSLKGKRVDEVAGANAKEQSRQCIEKALENGASVCGLPVEFSRSILCSLDSRSPLLSTAAQLQLNPWAFSFLQEGPTAHQFAESNQQNGALLLQEMDLTYDSLWEKVDGGVRTKIENLAARFKHWNYDSVVRNRLLWAIINFGGGFPWKSADHTSVSPPFNDLCSVLNTENVTPLELFEFRVQNVSSFTGVAEDRVRRVLSLAVLYDLYAVVLLKHGLFAERVIQDPKLLIWFRNHVQTFVKDS